MRNEWKAIKTLLQQSCCKKKMVLECSIYLSWNCVENFVAEWQTGGGKRF